MKFINIVSGSLMFVSFSALADTAISAKDLPQYSSATTIEIMKHTFSCSDSAENFGGSARDVFQVGLYALANVTSGSLANSAQPLMTLVAQYSIMSRDVLLVTSSTDNKSVTKIEMIRQQQADVNSGDLENPSVTKGWVVYADQVCDLD